MITSTKVMVVVVVTACRSSSIGKAHVAISGGVDWRWLAGITGVVGRVGLIDCNSCAICRLLAFVVSLVVLKFKRNSSISSKLKVSGNPWANESIESTRAG